MEEEVILAIIVERSEERDALDVVPVEVRKKDVRIDRLARKLGVQALSQIAESGTAIEDEHLAVDAHFYTGSIAPITQILRLRSGSRSAYTPEFHSHSHVFVCDSTHVI